jgi:hypothetical protein
MALDVTATIQIDAAPDAVAAVEFDPSRDPEWIGGVTSAEHLTEEPFGVGSRVRRLGAFLGRPIEWVMQVEAFEPGRLVAMHALKSPFPMDVDYVIEPLQGGHAAQASIRIRGEGRGMYGLPGRLTGPLVRRSVQSDLRRLKQIVEGPGHLRSGL